MTTTASGCHPVSYFFLENQDFWFLDMTKISCYVKAIQKLSGMPFFAKSTFCSPGGEMQLSFA